MSATETQNIRSWNAFKSIFRLNREKRVAIIVDGPNLLRKHGNRQIKIEDIDKVAQNLGSIKYRYILLNHHASKGLVEAMVNSGYTPLVVHSDLYVMLTMKALEISAQKDIDIMVIASRDARVVPLLTKVKENNIDTAIIGFNPGFSIALSKTADHSFEL
ncbi:MAG: NYN domain-containing protein [Candidatus Heimdallarchaeota archaeon]|nr:NYN domain-containing protein [Candidatus Heimdallarchaeota archaeon]